MDTMRTMFTAVALATSVALGAGMTLTTAVNAQTDTVETQDSSPTPTDRMQRFEERLQSRVDDGVITQERADEIRARIVDRSARREVQQAERAERTQELAALLGTTAEELATDLRSGASLADIAEAAGIDIDLVIDHLEAQITNRINQAVADGHIDQTRADEKLATLRDDILSRVNGERPEDRRGSHGRDAGRGGFGRGGIHGQGFGRHHHSQGHGGN